MMPAPINAKSAATIAEIAAGVTRGTAMQLAEAGLNGLRRRRDQLQAEMNEAATAYRAAEDRGQSVGRAEIDKLTLEIREVEAEITATRPRVSQMRSARAARVSKALADTRREAANKAQAALMDLHEAVAVMQEIADTIRKSGDADQMYVPTPPTASIQEYVAKFTS